MVDIHSTSEPLTVQLPSDLIAQLRMLAQEKDLSIDELVREACLDYTEPRTWERVYQQWLHDHPEQSGAESAPNGIATSAVKPSETQA